MDIHEQTASELELEQTKDYRKSTNKNAFFDDPNEIRIFNMIKSERKLSKTYHPDNER